MPQEAESPKRCKLSWGALAGLAIAIIAFGWLVYAFLAELAPPPATQQVGDLEVSLYSTLSGRPRVGDNQFEVKLRDRQGQPVVQAEVEVAYSMGSGDERGNTMRLGRRAILRGFGWTRLSATCRSYPSPTHCLPAGAVDHAQA